MAETLEERNQRRFNETADTVAVVRTLAYKACMDIGNYGVLQRATGRTVTQFDGPREGWGLHTEIDWKGFDGKTPTTGRKTTTLATDLAYNDTRWASNRAAHKAQAEAIAALSQQVADLTALVQKLVTA